MHISPFYLATAQSQCLEAILRDDGLSTLCHSSGFVCQQIVLKTFRGPGSLCSEDVVVCLWHFLINLQIYGSPFYFATTESKCLVVTRRVGGLSTLCHSCVFLLQQRVVKTFLGPGYLCTEDGIFCL